MRSMLLNPHGNPIGDGVCSHYPPGKTDSEKGSNFPTSRKWQRWDSNPGQAEKKFFFNAKAKAVSFRTGEVSLDRSTLNGPVV